ncbi:hypothetical protein X922_05095 [Pseudomonas aeruginosa VRFPA08]|nr:hypothetical protein X922_05095 [Pseudomonas aeruginosa VRFPA08]
MRSPTRPPAAADPASRRSVFAVVLGNAVEFFDFGVYATFAVMIGRTFFPSDSAFVSLLLSVTAFGVGFVILRESEISQKGKARKLWDIEEGKGI